MIKIYSLVLILTSATIVFSITDQLDVTLECQKGIYHDFKIAITDDDWTLYSIDIRAIERDSISSLKFGLKHMVRDGLYLYIDKIVLNGSGNSKILEDFSDYDTGYVFDTKFNDRYWTYLAATDGSIPTFDIIEDEDSVKCLRFGGYNKFSRDTILSRTVQFRFYPILCFGHIDSVSYNKSVYYQNWSEYESMEITIKRKSKRTDDTTTIGDTTTIVRKLESNKFRSRLTITQNSQSKLFNVSFPLSESAINISIYDLKGKRITTLRPVSKNNYLWNYSAITEGVYVLKAICKGIEYTYVLPIH